MRKKQTPIEYIVNSLNNHFRTLGRDGVEYRISDVHLKTMIRYAKKLDEELQQIWNEAFQHFLKDNDSTTESKEMPE